MWENWFSLDVPTRILSIEIKVSPLVIWDRKDRCIIKKIVNIFLKRSGANINLCIEALNK